MLQSCQAGRPHAIPKPLHHIERGFDTFISACVGSALTPLLNRARVAHRVPSRGRVDSLRLGWVLLVGVKGKYTHKNTPHRFPPGSVWMRNTVERTALS